MQHKISACINIHPFKSVAAPLQHGVFVAQSGLHIWTQQFYSIRHCKTVQGLSGYVGIMYEQTFSNQPQILYGI